MNCCKYSEVCNDPRPSHVSKACWAGTVHANTESSSLESHKMRMCRFPYILSHTGSGWPVVPAMSGSPLLPSSLHSLSTAPVYTLRLEKMRKFEWNLKMNNNLEYRTLRPRTLSLATPSPSMSHTYKWTLGHRESPEQQYEDSRAILAAEQKTAEQFYFILLGRGWEFLDSPHKI